MQIVFRYDHVDHSLALEEHITSKMQSVAHLIEGYHTGDLVRLEVVFKRESAHKGEGMFLVRAHLHMPGTSLEADASSDDLYRAVDILRDTLHGSVQRYKEHEVAKRHAGN